LAKRYPITKKVASDLFGFSERTFQSWRTDHNESKKEHPIIDLIEKYFTEKEIQEFLQNKKIEKYEYIEYLATLEKEKLLKMAEKILADYSETAKFILKVIQKYEQRYYHLKKKHIEAEKKEQYYIRYGDNEEFNEILKYPEGYLKVDKYLTSIIFNPEKLSELLGKKLLPRSLFDLQSAIQEISNEKLVPVIKKNMNYLLEKTATYKSKNELENEFEENQADEYAQYQEDIETLTIILKEKGVIQPDVELSPFGDIESLNYEDEEYINTIHGDVEKLRDIYIEKSYNELVNMAIKSRPSPSTIRRKMMEDGGFDKDFLNQIKNKKDK